MKAQQAIKSMKALVVGNDDECRIEIPQRLMREGYRSVVHCISLKVAEEKLRDALRINDPIDAVILGVNSLNTDTIDFINNIWQKFSAPYLLIVNAEQTAQAKTVIGRANAEAFSRPVPLDLFVLKLEKLLIRRYLRKELGNASVRHETIFLNVLAVMAKVMETKDPHTRNHSERVALIALSVARELGLSEIEVRRVGVAGILHDIGKMGVRDSILEKAEPLDPHEREAVEQHPIIASTILEPIEQLRQTVEYIKYHHERMDGTGYPAQLSGESIPIGARIIHVAEAFDEMISQRAYNVPRDPEDALHELRRCAGRQFDPRVVEALAAILKRDGKKLLNVPEKSLTQLLDELTRPSGPQMTGN